MARFDINAVFDRSGTLTAPPLSALLRELWALQFYAPPRPDPKTLPNGGGRTVLIIPAFLTGDAYTAGLRAYLASCGFNSIAAGIGTNWGPTAEILTSLRRRLSEVRRDSAEPVALIGISLGGLLAHDLAFDFPSDIAHVATVGTPINLPTATNLETLVRLCACFYSKDLDLKRLERPLSAPWTSIYSKRDGLVAWQSCVSDAPGGVCIEVNAPHIAMARNPEALKALVTRLAGG